MTFCFQQDDKVTDEDKTRPLVTYPESERSFPTPNTVILQFGILPSDKPIPASTEYLYNIYTMSNQRRRRWADFV